MASAPKHADRCEFIFSDGRRCRQLRAETGAAYCTRHWRCQQQREQSARVGDEIVGAEGALNTQEGIHNALTNVFANLARKRISARDASVLAYVGQLMLTSRPSLEHTIKSFLPLLQLSLKMGSHEAKSHSDAQEGLRKRAMFEFDFTERIIEQFNLYKSMSAEDRLRLTKFLLTFVDKKEAAPGTKKEPAQKPAA